MASRSRLLPLLAITVLGIAVLSLSCRTGRQTPFHYAAVPGESIVAPSDLVVEIGEHCHADPERAVIDIVADDERDSHDQVVWHIPGEQPGDRVVISAKPAEEQDADLAKGREIRNLLQERYEVSSLNETPPNNAIRSGKPKKSLLFIKQHSADWKYNIEYFRDGKKLCAYDPTICIQKPGSDGCSMSN